MVLLLKTILKLLPWHMALLKELDMQLIKQSVFEWI